MASPILPCSLSPPSYALVLAVLWYRAAETFPWQPVPGVRQAPTPARRRVKATHTLGFLSSWGCSLSLCLYDLVGVEVLCTYRGLYCIGQYVVCMLVLVPLSFSLSPFIPNLSSLIFLPNSTSCEYIYIYTTIIFIVLWKNARYKVWILSPAYPYKLFIPSLCIMFLKTQQQHSDELPNTHPSYLEVYIFPASGFLTALDIPHAAVFIFQLAGGTQDAFTWKFLVAVWGVHDPSKIANIPKSARDEGMASWLFPVLTYSSPLYVRLTHRSKSPLLLLLLLVLLFD